MSSQLENNIDSNISSNSKTPIWMETIDMLIKVAIFISLIAIAFLPHGLTTAFNIELSESNMAFLKAFDIFCPLIGFLLS